MLGVSEQLAGDPASDADLAGRDRSVRFGLVSQRDLETMLGHRFLLLNQSARRFVLAFMWAGHSYAPDGCQIQTFLLDEFLKLLQSSLDRAPDAVRSLGRIGFVGTGQLLTRDLDEGEPLKHVQADVFGLLGADLSQQPIDNQLAVDLVLMNRDVQILGPVMDLDFPVAIGEVATISSVLSGTKTAVGRTQIRDFPLRHVRRA